MAGEVVNIKVCSPLKLRSGLIGKYHAICHYSYNLPLPASLKNDFADNNGKINERKDNETSQRTKARV